jgi:hypothetical protein
LSKPDSQVKVTNSPATAEIDVQDPLPESNFLWRRLYSYIATVSIWALLVFVVYKMDDQDSLRTAALYLCLLLWFTITYYMIAPSAEQITRIVQAARTLRSGVEMTRKGRVERGGRVTEAETHIGRPERPDDEPDAAPRSRYHD